MDTYEDPWCETAVNYIRLWRSTQPATAVKQRSTWALTRPWRMKKVWFSTCVKDLWEVLGWMWNIEATHGLSQLSLALIFVLSLSPTPDVPKWPPYLLPLAVSIFSTLYRRRSNQLVFLLVYAVLWSTLGIRSKQKHECTEVSAAEKLWHLLRLSVRLLLALRLWTEL